METVSELKDVDAFSSLCAALRMKKLKKPLTAGGVMAGSIATIAVLWGLVQTMGYFGHSHTIGNLKMPFNLDSDLIGTGLPSWSRESLIIDSGILGEGRLKPLDEKTLNSTINFATAQLSQRERLEQNLESANIVPHENSPAYSQYIHSYPNTRATNQAADAMVAILASTQLLNTNCIKYGYNEQKCAQYISTIRMDNTPLGASCSASQETKCDPESIYRTIDGTCNNPQNPKWGGALTAYGRLLFPQYADGIQVPRQDYGHRALPNPRAVSVTMDNLPERLDVSKTLAVMQWTQFVSHDIAYTPVRKMVWTGKPISCCTDDGQKLSPRYVHPSCAAIIVPDHDPVFAKQRIRCLNYVRSLPAMRSDCTFGPTEQVSHFLDASTIYGSSQAKSDEIRQFEGGLLRTESKLNRHFLPNSVSEPAALCQSNECYLTGDERANSEPHLAVLHTLWHREHNRIARKLSAINPEWSDEVLYQEARRIVIAEIQHITYKELLPILVGKKFARSVGLGVETNFSIATYNPDHDPTVSNELATAALQFRHSLKQGKLSMTDNERKLNSTLKLSEHFYKPRIIESADVFDGLIRGLATQTVQKLDLRLVPDITQELFKKVGALGLDQLSLDIQRSRDHGLPGYNDYRKFCGLRAAKTFEDFLDYIPLEMVKKLKELYKRPADVDLVIGGMAEKPVDDALLGPTFRCLVAEHFLRTRRTDRYFYDSEDQPVPFTPAQLKNVKKVTLARIFCDNGDHITKMQPNVFIKPQLGNELTPCKNFEKIPSIDLFAWAEKAKAYR